MSATSDQLDKQARLSTILVYAAERIGITAPNEPLTVGSTLLQFEPFDTLRRFDEFDGVITFQGIFERIERVAHGISPYTKHDFDHDALDKRKKEASLLAHKGGFVCFLLVKPFVDRSDGCEFQGTDLAKFRLSHPHLYRENFRSRITQVRVMRDEFRNFLHNYGAAWSHFRHFNDYIDWHVIAEVGGKACGMVINQTDYFVPSLVPDDDPDVVADYFTKLTTAIRSARSKLDQAIPEWVDRFEFEEENSLRSRRAVLAEEIESIDTELQRLHSYKGVLVWSGSKLVDGVAELLSRGLGFSVDSRDEHREDLKLVNDGGDAWCFVEVKGVNRGVNRESINQADSHRERSGFQSNFPTVLITNVGMRAAPTIDARDAPVAAEQIRHAHAMGVLVLRTLDLLRLLKLYKEERISRVEIQSLFTGSRGWLHVSEDGWTANSGQEAIEP